jgi:hypothetical protein
MDRVSLATPSRPDDGVAAHRVLCGVAREDRYLLIVEDIDLNPLRENTERIYVLPPFVAEAHSSPCAVAVESSEEQSLGEAVPPP